MNHKKTDYLNQVDVLQDLSEAEIEQVSDQTHMVDHRRGHIFYMPDDPGEVLFILKKGRIQLYRMSPDGQADICNFASGGDFWTYGIGGATSSSDLCSSD